MNPYTKYYLPIFMLFSLNGWTQDYKTAIASYRENYKQDFLKGSHSPLKEADLKELHFFDADSTYNVTADVEHLINEQTFMMPTSAGTTKEYIRYAVLKFIIHGKAQKLTVYKSVTLSKKIEYRDHLFLPFMDQTNGKESYGGGRYIDLNINDITNNKIKLDFNKAYNPYCAYSDGYQCPKPPEENNLEIKINAGEQLYTGDKKHK